MPYSKVDRSHIVIEGKRPRHIYGMDSFDCKRVLSPSFILGSPSPSSTLRGYWEIHCRFHGTIAKLALLKANQEGNTNISGDVHDKERGLQIKFHNSMMESCQVSAGYMGNVVTEIVLKAEDFSVSLDNSQLPEKVLLT